MLQSHNEDSMAGIGTILEIQNHERLDDGRLDIESQGGAQATFAVHWRQG